MKLSALNFSNANNSSLSLREIAEKVRTGELKLKSFDHQPDAGYFRIDLTYTPEVKRAP